MPPQHMVAVKRESANMLAPKQKCGNCGLEVVKTFSRDGLTFYVCPHVKPQKVNTEHGFRAYLYC